MKHLLFTLLLTTPFLAAQNGDRGAHNLDSVVPEDVIPPSPVLAIDDALKSFQLADGFVIEPVAVEPLVDSPVALRFDGDGRMWVIEMRGYMEDLDGTGEDIPKGRITVLEDTDNDGQADKRTVFLDKILLPRAIALVKDGILIGDEYHLSFCGRDGVKRTSDPVIIDDKFAPSGNVEHKPNSLLPHLNNWLYNAKSDQRYRWKDGELLKDKTEFRGQWGLTMDSFGRIYSTNNSTILRGERLLPETIKTFPKAKLRSKTSEQLGSNRVFPSRVTPGLNRAYIAIANGYEENILDPKTYKVINTTATAGVDFYRGDQFPDSWRDVAFSTDCGANLVKATRVTADGLKLSGKHVFPDSEFLTSSDERFRPVNIHTAPDGSLYLVDYYHGVIQHSIYMTSYLRAQYQSRGLEKPGGGLGRIYRIRHKDKPLGPQPKLQEATIEELVKTLSRSNGWYRDTAQRLLVERKDAKAVPALEKLLVNGAKEEARIQALWTLQGMDQLKSEVIYTANETNPSEALLTHSLVASKGLPGNEKLISRYVTDEKVSTYILALEATHNQSDHELLSKLLKTHNKAPYAAEVTATGLLSQGITDFPANNVRLVSYLRNAARHNVVIPADERLTGEHLNAYKRGRGLFLKRAACIGCHGADGEGLPNLGPPLNESEWVTGNPERLAKILLHGLKGPITVNGTLYEPLAAMPGLGMNPTIKDADIADIMTFIRAEWDNKASYVEVKTVTEMREATKERGGHVYTAEELDQ